MGPELAFALLTVFFYAWNSRRKNKIRGIPIVEPLTTLRNFAESDLMSKAKESFGIGNNSNSDTPNETTGSQNELNEHSVITTCKRAMSMLRLHNTIKTAANNGSGLNWYDMFFHNEILKYICKESDDHGTQPLQESDTEHLHLQNIVSRFGLQVVPMPKDGDCLFNSVAFGIFQRFQSSSSSSSDPIVQHYASLGIQTESSQQSISQMLRNIMTNELKKNKAKYLPFLENFNNEEYDDVVETFRQVGVFTGNVGDLMVKAIANALKTPLVLITTITNYPVITVTPDEFADTYEGIFITFTRDGPGHYDALVEDSVVPTDVEKGKEDAKCTCGMTRKQAKETCTNTKTKTGRTYTSRCPCLRDSKACSNLCKCKGCDNPFGKRSANDENEEQQQNRRRRARADMIGERKDGTKYMNEENEELTYGKWTDEENFIFLQHILLDQDVLTADDCEPFVELLTKNFNSSVVEAKKVFGYSHIGQKKEKQIKRKIETIKKKKELLYRVLEDQIQQFITQLEE